MKQPRITNAFLKTHTELLVFPPDYYGDTHSHACKLSVPPGEEMFVVVAQQIDGGIDKWFLSEASHDAAL